MSIKVLPSIKATILKLWVLKGISPSEQLLLLPIEPVSILMFNTAGKDVPGDNLSPVSDWLEALFTFVIALMSVSFREETSKVIKASSTLGL